MQDSGMRVAVIREATISAAAGAELIGLRVRGHAAGAVAAAAARVGETRECTSDVRFAAVAEVLRHIINCPYTLTSSEAPMSRSMPVLRIVLALVCCGHALQLDAQSPASPPPTAIGVFFGGGAAHGAFAPRLSSGVSLGVIVQQRLGASRFAVRGTLSSHAHAIRGCDLVGSACVDQHRTTFVRSMDVALVTHLAPTRARWSPYLMIGGVTHAFDSEFPTILRELSPRRSGPLFGAGFEVRHDRTAYFGEWRRLAASPGGFSQVNIGGRLALFGH